MKTPRPTVHLGEQPSPFGQPACGRVVPLAERVSAALDEVSCVECNRRAAAMILLGQRLS